MRVKTCATQNAANRPEVPIRLRTDMRSMPDQMQPTGGRPVCRWHGTEKQQQGQDRLAMQKASIVKPSRPPSPELSLLVVRVLRRKVDMSVVCALDSHYEHQCGED